MVEKLSDERLREIITFDGGEWTDLDGIPSIAEDVAMAGELLELRSDRDRLRDALRRIAAGDGYYGAMAREYKEIAREALNEQRSVLGGAARHAPSFPPGTAQAERGAAAPDKSKCATCGGTGQVSWRREIAPPSAGPRCT